MEGNLEIISCNSLVFQIKAVVEQFVILYPIEKLAGFVLL